MARRTLRVFAVAALLSLLAVPGWGQSDAGYDAYKRGDYATAHRIWKSLAEGGNASAQYNLGLLYHHGLGVERQLGEACIESFLGTNSARIRDACADEQDHECDNLPSWSRRNLR